MTTVNRKRRFRTLPVLVLCALLLLQGTATAFAEDATLKDLSEDDFLVAKVEELLSGRSGDITIGYYYSQTGYEWYYNADVWMYSASLYKVPNCMLLEEQENAGEISQDTVIDGYTVAEQEYRAIVLSDNDRGHDIVRFNGGGEYSDKCADRFIKYTDLPEEYFTEEKFTGDSYYTARFYNRILMYLLRHSEEYPHVIDLMKQTQPGHYINTMHSTGYEVAQKYGSYDKKADGPVFHAAGIVYTPHPFVMTVMTRSAGYDEQLFGDLADILVEYTLMLDEAEQYKAEMAASAASPEPVQTAAPAVESTPQPVQESPASPVESPAPEEPAPAEQERSVPWWVFAAGIAVAAGIAGVLLSKRGKREDRSEGYTPRH